MNYFIDAVTDSFVHLTSISAHFVLVSTSNFNISFEKASIEGFASFYGVIML